MKKWLLLLLSAFVLAGCGAEETLETVADELDIPVMATPREVTVSLPGETDLGAVEGGTGRLYLANDYQVAIETLDAGDLDKTIREMSGFHREDLTVLETQEEGFKRYEFVWVSAGETGEQLGHGIILDDGNYHYCMTVLRDADRETGTQVVWDEVFQSFSLAGY